MSHTRIERLILYELLSRQDWETISLWSLVHHLDIDYSWAWTAVTRLEREGWLRTDKPRGRDMLISLRGPYGFKDCPEPNPSRGPVSPKFQRMTHNAKIKGETMSNIINALRAAISSPSYPRPELTEEEKEKLKRKARQLAAIKDDRLRLAYFITVCVENALLVREVNEHRQARGYDPLPIYDPEPQK